MSVEFGSTFRACITGAAALAAGSLGLVGGATVAPASDLNVTSAYGDAHGNLVIHGRGGEKIIVVGGASKAKLLGDTIGRTVPVAQPSSGLEVVEPPRDPHVIALVDTRTDYCGGPVVLRGRSFMYGIDRNVTPVLGQPGC